MEKTSAAKSFTAVLILTFLEGVLYNESVPVPPVPLLFEQVGGHSFSFFPAIIGIKHNEWILRRATWSEVEVINTKSGVELSIPRRLVGEVSEIEEPFLIVGLVKELEYREGAVWPHQRRVIEMPRAVNGSTAFPARRFEAARTATVVGIRVEPESPRPAWRRVAACVALILMLIAAGILAWIQAVESHFRWQRQAGSVPEERVAWPDKRLL